MSADTPKPVTAQQIYDELKDLSGKIDDLTSSSSVIRQISHEVIEKELCSFCGGIDDRLRSIQGTLFFIDGKVPAFDALTAALGRAKNVIRTTRYSAFSVTNDPEIASFPEKIDECISNGIEFHRIFAVNNRSKLRDIEGYFKKYFEGDCAFKTKDFFLYLTAYDNNFELVIIDEKEVFIHFNGQSGFIDSTLHIANEQVAEKFVKIYKELSTKSVRIAYQFGTKKVVAVSKTEVKKVADIINYKDEIKNTIEERFSKELDH
jgi:hypothetical protein